MRASTCVFQDRSFQGAFGQTHTHKPRKGVLREAHTRFLTHHVANISTAIQTADAQTILNAASARMLRVSFGVL
jgi:hypothetical protein